MAHTPGPWYFNDISSRLADDGFGHIYQLTDHPQKCLAHTGEAKCLAEENRANARLMASAPEFFDAADYANGCFQAALAEGWNEALADGDLERIRDIWNRRLSMACDKIIPAMAKATKA